MQCGDHEHGRAVHQHQVTGMLRVDAHRFRPGVDRAGDHGDAGAQSGDRRCPVADGAGHLAGPAQRGRLDRTGQLAPPRLIPGAGVAVVERYGLARRVMVEHVAAGQPPDQVRARHEQPAGRGERFRVVLGEPRQLGPDGLAGERRPAAVDDLRGAVPFGEPFDLCGCTGVDAVQDGGPERIAGLVGEYRARPHPAHPDRGDVLVTDSQQLAGQLDELGPPDAGVHLHLPGGRPRHPMLAGGLRA